MNRLTTLLILFISLIAISDGDSMAYAARKKVRKEESKESLSRRQQQNKKEIKETNKKIQSNAREVTRQLNELNLVTAEIDECKKNLRIINSSIAVLDKQIEHLTDSVTLLDDRLNTMSEKYGKAIRKMQTRNSVENSDFAFIFSAKSLAEAYYRSRSLKQFSLWRKKKSEEMTEMKSVLDGRRKVLEDKKADRMSLLDSLNAQMTVLSDKKELSDILVEQLRREGSQLKNILAQKQKEADDLDKELNRLIQIEQEKIRKAEEERQLAEKKKREEAERERLLKQQQEQKEKDKDSKKKNKPSTNKKKANPDSDNKQQRKDEKPVVNTPVQAVKPETAPVKEEPMVTVKNECSVTEFSKSKGKLPYPVKGKIVNHFGRQQHPELKHVVTDNPGIDIETSSGATVKSVFDGYVSDIFRLPGYNTIIMVRHGNYLTIYANLGSITVKKGDKVKQGQEIGKVFTDEDDGARSILHFEVRNERSKEDPEQWLK